GLRGPVLRGWAMILELKLAAISSTSLTLKPVAAAGQCYKKHFVDLGGLGIRDLCLDAQDLLILAGPTMDLDGPVKVFRLEGGLHSDAVLNKPSEVLDLPYGNGDHHAEGMTLYSAITQHPSLLVVYDSPAATTKLAASNGVLADVFKLR
ncbi:MAG TPA: DUF3616 domain-containing protein, partial [Candidatus Caenarcaniphilales bacterium]